MKRPPTSTGRMPAGAPRRTRALGRWAALAATLTLLTSLLALPPAAAADCGVPGRIVAGRDWETIHVPAFSAGGRTIVDHAVGATRPDLMLVTNGTVVSRSADGGCTWEETFEAGIATQGLPGAGGTVVIKSIAWPEVAGSPVLLMAEERIGDVIRPRIFRSTNGGGSFAASDGVLPPTGVPETLRVAPSDPAVAYLGISQGDDLIDQIWATGDGGASWSLRSDLAEATKQQNIEGFEVDPGKPNELWASGPAGGYVSADGGKTFTAVDDLAGQTTGPVDVYRGSSTSRVGFFRPLKNDMLVSVNGGGSWLSLGTPAQVDSAAHGSEPLEMVVTTKSGNVYTYLPIANAWVDLQAPASVHDAVIARTGDAQYYARSATTIERYIGRPPGDIPPPRTGQEVIVPSIDDLPDIEEAPADLSGPTDLIELKPGSSRTLTYMLDLPKGQRPLDLFFLVDTTGSMKKFVDGLKLSIADIVNGLGDAGIAAYVGLGEYRAYPDFFPPRPDEPNFVYKRRADLSADTEALREALQALEYDGGGQYDAQLGALEQVATGRGADLDPQGPAGQDVPPGQQPSFRKVAEENGDPLRLVLNVSNEPFGRPNNNRNAIQEISDRGSLTPPDIPTFRETIDALNRQGIKQIGLELGRAPGTFTDLAKVAEGTETFAPEQGVDCDGDGITDIAGGEPLVCNLGGDTDAVSNIAPAIVNLVKSLPLKESPRMNVTQGAEVVTGVTPNDYDGVPLQAGQSLPFRVTFTCTKSQAGLSYPVTLQAAGTDEILDQVQTEVACGPLPVKPGKQPPTLTLPPPPAVFIPAVLIPVLPPVAPPTAPIPITEISSATSSQAQTQAQAQAQAAAAAQRQQQPQLAFAHSQKVRMELAKEEQYEMSAYNRRQPEMPPSPALVAAAAAMAFGFALAMRRKNGVNLAYSRRRRF